VEEKREERYMLDYPCSQINCKGYFTEIFWFNKFGDKISWMKKKTSKNGTRSQNPLKVLEEDDQCATKFFDDGLMDDSKTKEDMHCFISHDKIDDSGLGITASMITAMDFEKLYEIDRQFNEPFQLNDEPEDDDLNADLFGIIGGERKNKKQKNKEKQNTVNKKITKRNKKKNNT